MWSLIHHKTGWIEVPEKSAIPGQIEQANLEDPFGHLWLMIKSTDESKASH